MKESRLAKLFKRIENQRVEEILEAEGDLGKKTIQGGPTKDFWITSSEDSSIKDTKIVISMFIEDSSYYLYSSFFDINNVEARANFDLLKTSNKEKCLEIVRRYINLNDDYISSTRFGLPYDTAATLVSRCQDIGRSLESNVPLDIIFKSHPKIIEKISSIITQYPHKLAWDILENSRIEIRSSYDRLSDNQANGQ